MVKYLFMSLLAAFIITTAFAGVPSEYSPVKVSSKSIESYMISEKNGDKVAQFPLGEFFEEQIDIAKSRCNFWGYTWERGSEHHVRVGKLSEQLRLNVSNHRDITQDVINIFELDNERGLLYAVYYKFYFPNNIFYTDMLCIYFIKKYEQLSIGDKRARVLAWCENHNPILTESHYSPYIHLRNRGNPCSLLAYSVLNGEDISSISLLKYDAINELNHLLLLAENNVDYLEYVFQNLFLCGFCFEEDEYHLFLKRTFLIIDSINSME